MHQLESPRIRREIRPCPQYFMISLANESTCTFHSLLVAQQQRHSSSPVFALALSVLVVALNHQISRFKNTLSYNSQFHRRPPAWVALVNYTNAQLSIFAFNGNNRFGHLRQCRRLIFLSLSLWLGGCPPPQSRERREPVGRLHQNIISTSAAANISRFTYLCAYSLTLWADVG